MNGDQQEHVAPTNKSSETVMSRTIPLPVVPKDISNSNGEATEEDGGFKGIIVNIPEVNSNIDVFHPARVRGLERKASRHHAAQNIRPEELMSAQVQTEP